MTLSIQGYRFVCLAWTAILVVGITTLAMQDIEANALSERTSDLRAKSANLLRRVDDAQQVSADRLALLRGVALEATSTLVIAVDAMTVLGAEDKEAFWSSEALVSEATVATSTAWTLFRAEDTRYSELMSERHRAEADCHRAISVGQDVYLLTAKTNVAVLSSSLLGSLITAWLGLPLLLVRLRGRLARPPGWSLRSVTGFLYSAKTQERVFAELFNDFDREYFTSLAAGDLWRARRVYAGLLWSVWSTVALHAVTRIADSISAVRRL
jgi:hypothetical protein